MDPKQTPEQSDNIEDKLSSAAQNPAPEQVQQMPRKSRLSKSFQKKSRNTFILSVLGILAILFLLFRYGLPLISDASFLFGRVTSTPETNEKATEEEFAPVPDLDSLPKATKSEFVRVGGTSATGVTVEIYLNGKKSKEVKVDENGDFETKLTLSEGENIIKARAVKGETQSSFTENVTISFIKEGPELSIDSPSDGAQIKGGSPIEVKGKSDPDTNIIVNDFQAIANSLGEWSYMLTLKDGDNEIKVVSTDAAGNKTEKIIHVTYSQ